MYLTPSKTDLAKQARQKIVEARQTFDAIRGDKKLSPDGKREAMAREWWRRSKEVRALEAAELSSKKASRDSLHRQLFGTEGYVSSTDIISQRDAADRAARLESPEEAERLITSARRNGDTVLLKAIAEHAFHQRWIGVLEHWADGDTQVEDQISELYRLNMNGSSSSDLAALLGHSMAFTLEKPSELAGLPTTALDAMVGEPTTDWGESQVTASEFGRSDRAKDYAPALNSPSLAAALGGGSAGEE